MIVIDRVSRRHGAGGELREVSLRVEKGSVHALIGPSGGGKSTLLRCINGLASFDAGEIRIDELCMQPSAPASRDVALLREIRQRVGFVFQQFHLFPHMTVLANVIEAPTLVLGLRRDEAIAQAEELLRRVGLWQRADAYPAQLSGGQQQRVAIARTLAMKPAYVLFDEPTSALDPAMASEVLSVIHELADAGQTMLVVTHAMRFAERVATHVHVLADGQLVESGTPAQIFSAPRSEAAQRVLATSRD